MSITRCYDVYQLLYGTVDGVEFVQGLPDFDALDPAEKHLIIIDDQMDNVGTTKFYPARASSCVECCECIS
jgi:L-lactate utilization protein LutB